MFLKVLKTLYIKFIFNTNDNVLTFPSEIFYFFFILGIYIEFEFRKKSKISSQKV